MMNTNIFWFICLGMFIVGLIANLLSWVLNKIYKNKMNSIADDLKSDK